MASKQKSTTAAAGAAAGAAAISHLFYLPMHNACNFLRSTHINET